jgi:diketogulonate reductase-like aldo/keto reductase
MKNYELDFVQLTYNILDREAENYLLPLAKEKGIAVIANRPFQGGSLFNYIENINLPSLAKDIGIKSWAEYFLKFVISNETITCAIPATSKINHMKQNMQALYGNILTNRDRDKLHKFFINI